jgi:hypothetical protein
LLGGGGWSIEHNGFLLLGGEWNQTKRPGRTRPGRSVWWLSFFSWTAR